jgi:hypothetical protein
VKKLNIEFGNPNTKWECYGLVEAPILYNGELSDFKAIIRDGRLLTITGIDYKLLPNEEVIKIADQVAEALGAKPFNQFEGEWYCKLKSHIIWNKKQTQVHCLYAFPDHIGDVGDNDTIHWGFSVHNSIDRSMGFGVGCFTFRHACSNMVFMAFKGYETEFDERKALAWVYNKHTLNFKTTVEDLSRKILKVVDKGRQVLEIYRRMRLEKINEDLLRKISASPLPRKLLPDYVPEDPREQIFSVPDYTKWECYNDLTAAIWHNAKTDIQSKRYQFNIVHNIFLR